MSNINEKQYRTKSQTRLYFERSRWLAECAMEAANQVISLFNDPENHRPLPPVGHYVPKAGPSRYASNQQKRSQGYKNNVEISAMWFRMTSEEQAEY